MNTLRPAELAAEIEAEAKRDGVSKSEVIRRRAERSVANNEPPLTMWDVSHDIIEKLEQENGSTLPRDLSSRKKDYLRKWGFGKNERHP